MSIGDFRFSKSDKMLCAPIETSKVALLWLFDIGWKYVRASDSIPVILVRAEQLNSAWLFTHCRRSEWTSLWLVCVYTNTCTTKWRITLESVGRFILSAMVKISLRIATTTPKHIESNNCKSETSFAIKIKIKRATRTVSLPAMCMSRSVEHVHNRTMHLGAQPMRISTGGLRSKLYYTFLCVRACVHRTERSNPSNRVRDVWRERETVETRTQVSQWNWRRTRELTDDVQHTYCTH